MDEVKYYILVCNSLYPKIHEVGCCNDKDAEAIIAMIEQQIIELNLQEMITLKTSACLLNCDKGLTIKVLPGGIVYGNVTAADVTELLQSHFVQKKVLKRLEIKTTNRFLGF